MNDTKKSPDIYEEAAIAEKVISYLAMAKEKGVNVLIVHDINIMPPLSRSLVMKPDASGFLEETCPLVGLTFDSVPKRI